MRGSFKTLSVYQDALHLVNLSYELIKIFPKQEKYNLSDQLRRACTSVTLNIAEGNGSHSWNRYRAKNDFRTPLPEIYKTYRHHTLETHPLDKTSADNGATRIIRWAYLTGGAHLYKVRKAVGSRSSSIDIKKQHFSWKRRKESVKSDSFLLLRYL